MIESEKFTIDHIYTAYRKLKHTIYYDSTYSFLRSQLAIFEQNSDAEFTSSEKILEPKFNSLLKLLNAPNEDRIALITPYINKISYWTLPKKLINSEECSNENSTLPDNTVITNVEFLENKYVSKDFKLINADIEIHLISVMWVLEGGYILENEMDVKPYGNRLELSADREGIVEGLRLFKPYFKNYQQWRDKAFKKSREIINEGNNSLIISLDIKNYYPTVNLNFKSILDTVKAKLPKEKQGRMAILTELLYKIHLQYAHINLQTNDEPKKVLGLPIGLQSSSVIANWFLKDLDKKIRKTINPAYYGRYVDDILLVISNPNIDKTLSNLKKSALKTYFIDTKIFSLENADNENSECNYIILNEDGEDSGLMIQESKSKLYYFEHDQPTALLDKIELELKIEGSEFRFLPEEKRMKQDFFTEAHYLAFDGSINKLRNVSGFGVNLFGASKYLAKKIKSSLSSTRKKDNKVSKQIVVFFKGTRAIESFKLWEKAITFFVATQDVKGLFYFINNVTSAIEIIVPCSRQLGQPSEFIGDKTLSEISREDEENRSSTIVKSLNLLLAGSIAMAFSLDTKLLNTKDSKKSNTIKKIISKVNKLVGVSEFIGNIEVHIKVIKRSNMLRQNYVASPLINFTNYGINQDCSFFDSDLFPQYDLENVDDPINLNFQIGIPPRFVHYHEIALAIFRNDVSSPKFSNRLNGDKHTEFVYRAKEEFFRFNNKVFNKDKSIGFTNPHPFIVLNGKNKNSAIEESESKIVITKIEFENLELKDDLVVGIVNYKINDFNIEKSYLQKPVFNEQRKEELYNILNNALDVQKQIDLKIDVLVMPELCVPYKALDWLCDFAQQHQILLIFGVEYWVKNNVAYNFAATLIPFIISSLEDSKDNFGALMPILRLKNHYAPKEINLLKSYRYEIPESIPARYHLFKWHGINFSVFNCYELADIQHRAMFKTHVDVLFACEYNPDTHYYSNIVESVVRDLHCYFVQSNNSNCGDSRVTRPTSSVFMNQMQIKGGINNAIIIDKIDIKSLHENQIQEDSYLESNSHFKPKPPGHNYTVAMAKWGKQLNKKSK